MIAIVDYGVGNLFSLRCSLLSLGLEASVTADPEEMQRFSGLTGLLFGKPEVSQFLLAEMRLQQTLADIFKIMAMNSASMTASAFCAAAWSRCRVPFRRN